MPYTPVPPPPGDPPLDRAAPWVFAYGSLMWRPGFAAAETRAAMLEGYHRDLCLLSIHYRGTPERPGLVCGLCDGGVTVGRALRIAPDQFDAVFKYLDERELITRIYLPRHVPVALDDGRTVTARVYVADPAHAQFIGDWSDEAKARHVAQGIGSEGRSFDYLRNIVEHLRELGIADAKVERIYALARELAA